MLDDQHYNRNSVQKHFETKSDDLTLICVLSTVIYEECVCTHMSKCLMILYGAANFFKRDEFYGRRQLERFGYKENILMGSFKSKKQH